VNQELKTILDTMMRSIFKGLRAKGTLPGGLEVQRRAQDMAVQLLGHPVPDSWRALVAELKSVRRDFRQVQKWVSTFALAVNEENAAMGRIVTSPTNGAAGVIPSILLYALCFEDKNEADALEFLLTAAEIGALFIKSATISAAMGGCQAEIGVSSAMAAAGLCHVLGGTTAQVLEAAEIAMEHHLGLTCDPVAGLVQVPCIERNAMGAIKAIAAADLALARDASEGRVSLDEVIETMWSTAQDMNSKYKETSRGGLALSVRHKEC
jgi:L-serine dehydratase